MSLTAKWSQPFTDYFIKNIHSVIGKLGSWVLQQHGLAEITGNQSEAYNSVIKRLQEWKEAPLDSMVLSFYRLVQFSLVEVCRGRKSLGDYELKPELKIVYKDDDTPILAAIAPEAIIQRIRDGLRQELEATSLEIPQNVSSQQIPQSVALHASSIERSKHIIEHGQLTLDPRLGVFVVNGSEEPRVRPFPTTTCSCPAVGRCYHIMAARRVV